MRTFLPLLLTILAPAFAGATAGLDGIISLVHRLVPAHQDDFTFSLMDGNGDSFVIEDTTGKTGSISISCTTGSACARGLYTYVTEIGNVDIWWTGSRLDKLPAILPSVSQPVNGSAIVPYRYSFNTVTTSYTAAFWDWEKWEQLLDWLALRGVNLPLAWVGYEHTLIEVFQEVGLSDADIASFLSGPAFQAWNRFGNIQGAWGGDLPMQWVNDQFALQQQIIARMVELGMTPVLPSFPGFVPRQLATLYPNASIVAGSQWSGFPEPLTDVMFLEPFDPLFATMQQSFITKQQAAYGNVSHFYTLDQYNENDPYSGDVGYLTNISAATFASMRAADPNATWVMQGWLFFASESFWTNSRIEAYLGGVDDADGMLILDLYSEAQPQWQRTDSYFGKKWIWCELHDYGGNMGFEGNLPVLTTDPLAALSSSGSSMQGMGFTPEGLEGNEIVYDILLDQAWSSTSIDIASYVQRWTARRYTVSPLPAAAQTAWAILSTTVYNNTNSNTQATIKSIYELEPAISGIENVTGHHPTEISYDTNTAIVPALQALVQAGTENPALLNVCEFVYDSVDVARQLLANRFIDAYNALNATWSAPGATSRAVRAAGAPLLDILGTLDALLATSEYFLLGTWIADARSWAGGNATYAAYLEYNARNQITLWGPDGEINDYASKAWAGLIGSYYKLRWTAFIDYLANITEADQPYNATTVSDLMLAIGEEWDSQTWGQNADETWEAQGDTWAAVQSVLQKWA